MGFCWAPKRACCGGLLFGCRVVCRFFLSQNRAKKHTHEHTCAPVRTNEDASGEHDPSLMLPREILARDTFSYSVHPQKQNKNSHRVSISVRRMFYKGCSCCAFTCGTGQQCSVVWPGIENHAQVLRGRSLAHRYSGEVYPRVAGKARSRQ